MTGETAKRKCFPCNPASLVTGAGVALVFILITLFSSCGGEKPSRPNVLFITLDTTRWDYVSCYDSTHVRTPALDGLAESGVVFERAFTTVPVTLPAHTSLLTGLYPPGHGVRNNGSYRLGESVLTAAEILRDAGYRTAAVTGAFVLDSQFGLDAGFEHYDDDFGGSSESRPSFSYEERPAGAVTAAALELVRDMSESSGSSPLFLWVHYFDPHYPYAPPPPFRERYSADPYAGEVAYMDAEIGRLLDGLEEFGVLDRAVIVVAGDHGEDLGDHGERSHGIFLYDSTVRVPLILSCPELLPAGAVFTDPVSLVDVVPTVTALLGLGDTGGTFQGENLVEAIRARRGTVSQAHRPLYLETLTPLENMGWSPLRGLVTDGWKYIEAPREELYRLDRDAGEQDNLAAKEEDRLTRMRAVLDSLESGITEPEAAVRFEPGAETRERLAALGYLTGDSGKRVGQADPKDMLPVLAMQQEGLVLSEEGEYREAEKAYARALELDPTNVTLMNQRALALYRAGDEREALALWHRARALSPGYLELRLNVGMAYLALGRPDSALAAYEGVLAANPRFVRALTGKGRALCDLGLFSRALEVLEEAVRLSPADAEARFQLGSVYRDLGRYQAALQEFEQAEEIDPSRDEARREVAMTLVELGRAPEAIEVFTTLLEENPRSADAHIDLGYALERDGRLDEALEHYRSAADLDPGSHFAWNNIGSVLDRLGRTAEAEDALRRALAVEEAFPEAHYNLGFVLLTEGREADAERELRRFLELWKRDDGARQQAQAALERLRSGRSPE